MAMVVNPHSFRSMSFDTHIRSFEHYAQLRIAGNARRDSVIIAFDLIDCDVDLDNAEDIALAVESHPRYGDLFTQRQKEAKLEELWSPHKSIHKLLCIVENMRENGTTRLGAIKELNVLANITFTDKDGNTRPGSRLKDFYESEEAKAFAGHPQPGTPAAEEFMAAVRKVAEAN